MVTHLPSPWSECASLPPVPVNPRTPATPIAKSFSSSVLAPLAPSRSSTSRKRGWSAASSTVAGVPSRPPKIRLTLRGGVSEEVSEGVRGDHHPSNPLHLPPQPGDPVDSVHVRPETVDEHVPHLGRHLQPPDDRDARLPEAVVEAPSVPSPAVLGETDPVQADPPRLLDKLLRGQAAVAAAPYCMHVEVEDRQSLWMPRVSWVGTAPILVIRSARRSNSGGEVRQEPSERAGERPGR